MSDSSNPNSIQNKTKALEDDKYLRVFKHLESVNLKNKAAFDELLRFTYSNIGDAGSHKPHNDRFE